jgi:hypothetical protein
MSPFSRKKVYGDENWVGSEEYDNGCLSGVLDEVLPLLLDDHNARQ